MVPALVDVALEQSKTGENALSRPWWRKRTRGAFDCVGTRFADANSAQDDRASRSHGMTERW
jgi:hypothetical protein